MIFPQDSSFVFYPLRSHSDSFSRITTNSYLCIEHGRTAATLNSTAGIWYRVPVFIYGTVIWNSYMALLYFFIIVGVVAAIGGIYATIELYKINKPKRKSR